MTESGKLISLIEILVVSQGKNDSLLWHPLDQKENQLSGNRGPGSEFNIREEYISPSYGLMGRNDDNFY